MSTSLFRAEAVADQQQRLWGDVLIVTPLATRLLTLLLLLAVAMAIAFLALGSYARKETVRGYLRAGTGAVKVPAPVPGIVGDIYVRAGSVVRRGDPLVQLLQSRLLADGRDGIAELDAVLVVEQQRLERQLRNERERAGLDADLLTERATQLRAERTAAEAELERRVEALRLARAHAQDLERLYAAGHAARAQRDAAAAPALDAEQAVATVRARLVAVDAGLRQNAIERNRQPLEAQARIDAVQQALAELSARRLDTALGAGRVVAAPADGVVSDVYVSAGEGIEAARPLVGLGTAGQLEAVMLVPSRAIGFVVPGQQVRLRYEAFPHQRFGAFSATISNVDGTLLVPSEVPDPLQVHEPVFRVRARPDHVAVAAYGQQLPLRGGLAFDADLLLEERSLLAVLFDPLLALRGRI